MLWDPERVHEKNAHSNVNRFPSSGNGGRGARERRETRRTAQRVTDILNQPPPMPLPPKPIMQPPPLPMMGLGRQEQQQQSAPPHLPPMPGTGAKQPAGLQPNPPGMPPPLSLNQLQQQVQSITKSLTDLEQTAIQQAAANNSTNYSSNNK